MVRNHFSAYVLIAEDNQIIQEVTRGMLEVLGCRVDTAVNGKEALEASSRIAYDLILMDCHMPEMDGYQAARAIREREAKRGRASSAGQAAPSHLPIIALTADALERAREECLNAGMDACILKPFTMDQLSAVMSRWIAEEASASASPGRFGDFEGTLEGSDGLPAGPSQPGALASSSGERTSGPVLDEDFLQRIFTLENQGRAGLFRKLVSVYLNDTPKRLLRLREAIHSLDPRAIQEVAHSLKSSSANLGALKLSALLKELEMMGEINSLQSAPELLSRIEKESIAVEAALKAELEGRM